MQPIGKLNAAIYRNLQSIINHRLGDIPILSGQCDFFFVISQNEGISQKGLSRHMFVNKSTTAKAVQNLVNKGLVEKRKDEHDGRLDRLFLTPYGRSIAPGIKQMFAENVAVASHGLSEEETGLLNKLLEKVLINLIAEKQGLMGGKDESH